MQHAHPGQCSRLHVRQSLNADDAALCIIWHGRWGNYSPSSPKQKALQGRHVCGDWLGQMGMAAHRPPALPAAAHVMMALGFRQKALPLAIAQPCDLDLHHHPHPSKVTNTFVLRMSLMYNGGMLFEPGRIHDPHTCTPPLHRVMPPPPPNPTA